MNGGRILDGIIEVSVYLVVFGSVLAFGAVEEWSLALMKFSCFLVFSLWLARHLWFPGKSPAAAPPAYGRTGSILGVEFRRTGLGWPILLFVLLVGFQLVPMPRGAIEWISPNTAALYEKTVPGYDGAPITDFADYSEWLLDRSTELRTTLQDVGAAGRRIDFRPIKAADRWRTLSLNPYLTRERLFRLLAYLAIFVVAVNHFPGPVRTRRAVLVLVGGGFAIALFGIAQKLSWDGRIYWWRRVDVGSPFGPYVNNNHFAGFMEIITLLAVGALMALLVGQRRRGSPGGKGLLSRDDPQALQQLLPKVVLAIFCIGVLLAAVVLSLSRAGTASVVACLLLFFLYTMTKRGAARKLSLVLILVGVLLVTFVIWINPGEVVERLETMSRLQDEVSLQARLIAWGDSLALVRDYPLFGTGLGTFLFAFQPYYSPGFVKVWDRLHNDYLEVLCDTGLIGFLIFLAGFALFAWKYLLGALTRRIPERNLGLLVAGCAFGVFALLLHSLVDFNLQIGANGLLFTLVAGVLVGNLSGPAGTRPPVGGSPGPRRSGPRFRAAGRGAGAVVVSLILFAGLVVSGVLTQRKIRADRLHRRADRTYWNKEYSDSLTSYHRALPLKPFDSNLWLHTAELHVALLETGETPEDHPEIGPWNMVNEAFHALRVSLDRNPAQSWPWSVLAQIFRQVKLLNQSNRVYSLTELSEDPLENLEPEDYLILAALSQARDYEPNSYFYRDLLGDVYWNAGIVERAIENYRAGVAMAPKTELHLFLQSPPLEEPQVTATLAGFEQALVSNPVIARDEIYRQFAVFQESTGDLEAAIESLYRAMESAGRIRGVEQFHIGRLYKNLGDLEKSNRALLEFLEYDPASGSAMAMLGSNYGILEDHEQAVRYYKRAIFQEPRRIRFHVALAREYERVGNLESAEAEYLTAIDIDPETAGVYSSLVKLYVEDRRYRKALNLLEEWREREPENPVSLNLLEEVRSHLAD